MQFVLLHSNICVEIRKSENYFRDITIMGTFLFKTKTNEYNEIHLKKNSSLDSKSLTKQNHKWKPSSRKIPMFQVIKYA